MRDSRPALWGTFYVYFTFGMPACSARQARESAERGVSSAGLTTQVHPAARAAPTFLVIMALGKFQGVIMAATPIGSFTIMICFALLGGTTTCRWFT